MAISTLFEEPKRYQSRGKRYDILADGDVVYHDVSEAEVDALCEQLEAKPWLCQNIEAVEL